jgi:ribonuclease Z
LLTRWQILQNKIAFCSAKQGVKSSPRQWARILLRKTRSKILSSPVDSDFAPQNKEDYMLDVCLLGTAGMMPLPHRWLTASLMRYNGSSLLIDCGEGTQIAIKEKGWTFKPIDVICFTHYHADHISGLPGLLLSMGNAERTEPLTMIGPKGLAGRL